MANKSDSHSQYVACLKALGKMSLYVLETDLYAKIMYWDCMVQLDSYIDEYSRTEELFSYHVHLANSIRVMETKWSSFTSDIKHQLIGLLRKVLDR